MGLVTYYNGRLVDSKLAAIGLAVEAQDERLFLDTERHPTTGQYVIYRKLERGHISSRWPIKGYDEHDPEFTAEGVVGWLRAHDRQDSRVGDMLLEIEEHNAKLDAEEKAKERELHEEAAEKMEFILRQQGLTSHSKVYLSGKGGR